MTKQKNATKDKTLKWFWLAVITVVLIWLFNAFGFQFINPSLASRAQNGDMFGPTNALFSGLAFVGLIYTIIMQRQELAMQRDELRMQRDELRMQRDELRMQREAMEESKGELSRQADAQQRQNELLERQNRLTSLSHLLERSKIRINSFHELSKKSPTSQLDELV